MQYKRWGETGFQSLADYPPVNSTGQLTAKPVIGLTTAGHVALITQTTIYFSQIWLAFFICLYFTNLITSFYIIFNIIRLYFTKAQYDANDLVRLSQLPREFRA